MRCLVICGSWLLLWRFTLFLLNIWSIYVFNLQLKKLLARWLIQTTVLAVSITTTFLVLGSIFIDVGHSGFGATGIQSVGCGGVIVIVVAAFLEILLLCLDFVDFFLDLLHFATDLTVTPAVRARVTGSLLVTVGVLLGRLHVVMLGLVHNLRQMMLFGFIVIEHFPFIIVIFVGFLPDARAFLGHAHVQGSGMCTHLRLGRMSIGLESPSNVVTWWRGYFREAWIGGLISNCCRHRLAHDVSQVARHQSILAWYSRWSAERLGGKSRELNGVVSRRWQFQFEQVLRELNCFEELRFSIASHLSVSTHYTMIHSFIFEVFLNSSYDNGHVQYLLTGRSLSGVDLQETFDNVS